VRGRTRGQNGARQQKRPGQGVDSASQQKKIRGSGKRNFRVSPRAVETPLYPVLAEQKIKKDGHATGGTAAGNGSTPHGQNGLEKRAD